VTVVSFVFEKSYPVKNGGAKFLNAIEGSLFSVVKGLGKPTQLSALSSAAALYNSIIQILMGDNT
jgi:hypothetical protein